MRMPRWYLIHTKPLSEELAQTNLERQGYRLYLPRATQAVRRHGHWQDRVVALFPRYLFLHLNEGRQSLGPVRFTMGVANVVRFGSQYTIVPDNVISDLLARADPETGLHRLLGASRLTAGTPVQIRRGPFDGLDAVFEREAGAERVVVLLTLLGHAVSAHVPSDSVRPRFAL
jgi:transcriptional antiterminator RfaH